MYGAFRRGNVTSSVACRAACHVMGAVLDTGLVDFADITELVDGMVASADMNGPAVFADSSVTLWSIFYITQKERKSWDGPQYYRAGSPLAVQ